MSQTPNEKPDPQNQTKVSIDKESETEKKTAPKEEKVEEKSPDTVFTVKLLKDLGQRIPIGLQGMTDRGFEFRPFMTEQEEKIESFKQGKRVTLGAYVMRALAYMLTRLGNNDFSKMAEPEKLLLLQRMYVADILYLYIWLRIEGMGDKMDYDLECSWCNGEFGFEFNLNTLEIRTTDEPSELVWEYDLKIGLVVGDKTYKRVQIKSPSWGIYDSSEFQGKINPATASVAILRNSILSLDGEPIMVTDQQLKKGLHKRDYTYLTNYMTPRMGGPKFVLEFDCPDCDKSNKQLIKWMDPDFLSMVSSKSIRVRL